MNNETLLIVSIGLCLGMVVLATYTGFSTALGAFIMGSILAETIEAEHIEHIIQPVKDLFGAIFFVSVGMLVNPAVLVEYAWPVIIITLVTIIGKAIFLFIWRTLIRRATEHFYQIRIQPGTNWRVCFHHCRTGCFAQSARSVYFTYYCGCICYHHFHDSLFYPFSQPFCRMALQNIAY